MNYTGLLSYIKTLDGYPKHKPIITQGSNVFEEYYDYYVVNGLLFVVGITEVEDPSVVAVYKVSLINPYNIKNVFVDKELNIDLSAISDGDESGFEAAAKAICEGLASGEGNYDIPTLHGVANIEQTLFRVNETFKTHGDMFSVEELSQDAKLFDKNATTDGTIVSNKIIFSTFDKIETLSVPLHAVRFTPFKDYVGEDILELSDNYAKNIKIFNGRPYKAGVSYTKGERIKARVDNQGTIEYRYYISKVNNNSDSPLDSDNWLEITSDIQEA